MPDYMEPCRNPKCGAVFLIRCDTLEKLEEVSAIMRTPGVKMWPFEECPICKCPLTVEESPCQPTL